MMLLVVMVVLFVFIPIYVKIIQTERTKVVNEHRFHYTRSVELFDGKIVESQQFISLLNNSYTFQRLKSLKNRNELIYYAKLNEATSFVQNAFRLTDSRVPSFVYLSNNDSVIAASLLSDTSDDFFRKKIIFDDWAPKSVLDAIMIDTSSMTFLPQHNVQIMGARNTYLPYIYRGIGDSLVFCVLFDTNLISEWFNLSIYENTEYFFYIVESGQINEDTIVFEQGTVPVPVNPLNQNGYTIFETKFTNLNYQCVLGISDVYFSSYVKPSKILLYTTIVAAIIIASFVSYSLATSNYRPLSDIISYLYSANMQQKTNKENEYSFLRLNIEKICQSNTHLTNRLDALRNEKRSNTLIRLAFDYPQQESDMRNDLSLLPQLYDNYRIAVVGYVHDSETVILSLRHNLHQIPPDSLCLARLKKNQIIMLLPDIDGLLDMLNKLVDAVEYDTDQPIHIGLSRICYTLSDLQSGLFQAQSALNKEKSVSIFECTKDTDGQQLQLRDQNLLVNYILNGNCDKATSMIRNIVNLYSENTNDIRMTQSYFLVRSAIEHAGSVLKCQELNLIDDTSSKTIMDMFSNLETTTLTLCEYANELINSGNQLLKQEIVQYVDQYYQSPDLTSNYIADHFRISDKYVFRLFKEQTGHTLNKYIETLRMQLAMDKIKNTNMSISKIALTCGYSTDSNFYKAFRKHYGQSPSFFRNTHNHTENDQPAISRSN